VTDHVDRNEMAKNDIQWRFRVNTIMNCVITTNLIHSPTTTHQQMHRSSCMRVCDVCTHHTHAYKNSGYAATPSKQHILVF
jgi:hypothetical protein